MTAPLRALAGLLVAAGVALVGAPPASAATRCAGASLVPSSANLAKVKRATLCLVNVERRKRGRVGLRTSWQLTRAARRHSASMVRQRFFSHVSPGGSTIASRVRRGTRYLRGRTRSYLLGENLAWGTGQLATPRRIVRAWMRSASHRRNVLQRRFRHIGLGVVLGSPSRLGRGRGATYTTVFGFRSRR